jgi:hypothetical protein
VKLRRRLAYRGEGRTKMDKIEPEDENTDEKKR